MLQTCFKYRYFIQILVCIFFVVDVHSLLFMVAAFKCCVSIPCKSSCHNHCTSACEMKCVLICDLMLLMCSAVSTANCAQVNYSVVPRPQCVTVVVSLPWQIFLCQIDLSYQLTQENIESYVLLCD